MISIEKRFANILAQRKEKGILRSLKSFDEKVDFFSNDYLGLAKTPSQDTSDVFSGTGSRLISGNSERILEIEDEIAQHFNAESALIFNSGYDANLGLLSSIPKRNDTIIYDELVHASARDGVRLSLAHSYSFKHNDLFHLEELLKKAKGEIFIVVESLYSMDGDFCPLQEIVNLCEKYSANLILDEAHSGGIYGRTGGGLAELFDVQSKIFARLYTFGKAFGSHGACIVGSKNLKDYLINFARSFIYTTALPPNSYERISDILSCTDFKKLQLNLQNKIELFTERNEFLPSPIQNIQFDSIDKLKETESKLLEAGFAVKAIYSPTVAQGQERLRICIHSFNTEEELQALKSLLV